jgi:hypothetical protein
MGDNNEFPDYPSTQDILKNGVQSDMFEDKHQRLADNEVRRIAVDFCAHPEIRLDGKCVSCGSWLTQQVPDFFKNYSGPMAIEPGGSRTTAPALDDNHLPSHLLSTLRNHRERIERLEQQVIDLLVITNSPRR